MAHDPLLQLILNGIIGGIAFGMCAAEVVNFVRWLKRRRRGRK